MHVYACLRGKLFPFMFRWCIRSDQTKASKKKKRFNGAASPSTCEGVLAVVEKPRYFAKTSFRVRNLSENTDLMRESFLIRTPRSLLITSCTIRWDIRAHETLLHRTNTAVTNLSYWTGVPMCSCLSFPALV